MLYAIREGSQATGGMSFVIVVGLLIWALSRLDVVSGERAQRKQRKHEIEAIVRARIGDVEIFREVLDELDKEGQQKP
jgi:hypothetical protein